MKRRTFLKTVGGAAGAAAMVGCSTATGPQSGSVQEGPSPGKSIAAGAGSLRLHGKRKEARSYVVAEKRSEPSTSIFRMDYRMPGWLPDAVDSAGPDSRVPVFPEEVFKYSSATGYAFKLPANVKPNPSWVLGMPLPPKNTTNRFSSLILDFAKAIRTYNAALYDLRRYHFKNSNIDLPENRHGKRLHRDPLPNPGTPAFKSQAQQAEKDWQDAVDALDLLIDPPQAPPLKVVAADMVQINNYIVSMRLIAAPSFGPNQIGGSESSHVSISSAFSSP
jgi:hypothetical protein